jgi:hypothetical protein
MCSLPRGVQSASERQGLAVIAINLDQDRVDADRFLKTFEPNFKVQFDPRGVLAEESKITGMLTVAVGFL